VPPLRLADAARGDDGRAERARAGRQGALPRLQRVDAGADPGLARPAGRRAVRLEPAAVLAALARTGGARLPALLRERHRPDRLVAARAGRADRQVPPGRAAAAGLPRRADPRPR